MIRHRIPASLLRRLVSLLALSACLPVLVRNSSAAAVGVRVAQAAEEEEMEPPPWNKELVPRSMLGKSAPPAPTNATTTTAPPRPSMTHVRPPGTTPAGQPQQEVGHQQPSSVPTTDATTASKNISNSETNTTGTSNSSNYNGTAAGSMTSTNASHVPTSPPPPKVNCSFQDELPLKHGLYSLRHVVNPVDQTIQIEFTFHGVGWVAFGVSPGGYMVGGQVVIAKTSEPMGPTNPGKYIMTSQTEGGVTLMDAQTLRNASWTQTNNNSNNNGTTVLRYTKLLREEGELPIDPDTSNTFIFAAGLGNEFANHGPQFGIVTLPSLAMCVVPGWSGNNDDRGGGNSDTNSNAEDAAMASVQNLWVVHGTLMAVVWAILVPVAIGCSLLRDLLPPRFKCWFQMHAAVNATAFLLQTAAFGVALYSTDRERAQHFHERHGPVGLAVYVVSVVQVLSGFFRPRLPTPNQSNSCHAATDHEANGDPTATPAHLNDVPTRKREDCHAGVESNDSDTKEPTLLYGTQEKSASRRAFEIGHRVLGLGLLGLAWYNCSTGIDEMVEHFGESYDKSSTLWGVVGGVSGFILLLFVYQLLLRPKGWK